VITRGWADPQNRGSLTTSAPLVPGEFVEFAFDLQPDDQVIPRRAHRPDDLLERPRLHAVAARRHVS
jgi:hypothetical protein